MDDDILGIALKKTRNYANQLLAGAVDGVTFKGSVDYVSSLPNDATLGDVYLVKYSGSSGTNPLSAKYVYDGTNWVPFSNTVTDTDLGIVIT